MADAGIYLPSDADIRTGAEAQAFALDFTIKVYALVGIAIFLAGLSAYLTFLSGIGVLVKRYKEISWWLVLFTPPCFDLLLHCKILRMRSTLITTSAFIFSAILRGAGMFFFFELFSSESLWFVFKITAVSFIILSFLGYIGCFEPLTLYDGVRAVLYGAAIIFFAHVLFGFAIGTLVGTAVGFITTAVFIIYHSQEVKFMADELLDSYDKDQIWNSTLQCSHILFVWFLILFMRFLRVFGQKNESPNAY